MLVGGQSVGRTTIAKRMNGAAQHDQSLCLGFGEIALDATTFMICFE